MEKLIQHMISAVESNAKNNQATIPDVEAWAIAWREEADKHKPTTWLEIWSQWIKSESKFGVVNLFDFLTDNYEPPVKKVSTNNQ
jgi:hypothetical protein